jgi:hypothetical protein
VARALVEAHGGKIWVEADPGKSTTFKVLIPVDHHFGEKDLMRGRVSRLIESLKKGDDDTPARAKFLPEETET